MSGRRDIAVGGCVALLAAWAGACQPRATRTAYPVADGGGPAVVVIEEAAPAQPAQPAPPAATSPSAAAPTETAPAVAGPAVGRACRVHLRRDAIGLTGLAPLPLQTVSPAARAAQLDGTIESAGGDWIVLRTRDRTYHLPTGVILAIEYLPER